VELDNDILDNHESDTDSKMNVSKQCQQHIATTHTLQLPLQSRHSVTVVIHFSSLRLVLSQVHDTVSPISPAASFLDQTQTAPHQAANASINSITYRYSIQMHLLQAMLIQKMYT